jgi:O-antigen/teichoic acid export membrane protein
VLLGPARRVAKPNNWVRKSLLATLDQGTYSITGFITSILLARSLTPTEYGAYTLAFTALLLIGMFHDSLVAEPLLVYGASKYHRTFGPYFQMLAKWQILATLGLSLCMVATLGIAPRFFPQPWSENILGLAVAMPAILLAWLVRRAFYASTNPGGALINSSIQAICILAGLYFVVMAGKMTALVAFLILGAGALISASLGWYRIRLSWRIARSPFLEQDALGDHWRYGRWLVLANVPRWFVLNGYTMLAGVLLGLSDVAGLRAMQTLVSPIPVMLNAFGTLALPWLVRQRTQAGLEALETSVSRLYWLFVGLAVLSVAPLLAFGEALTAIVYNGGYVGYVWLLPYLAGAQVLASGSIGLGLGLRSFEASRRLLVALMMAATSVAAAGYLATRVGGLHGLGFGMLVTQIVFGGALFFQLRRECHGRAVVAQHIKRRLTPADRIG